jgi:DNA-binding MarR family transcriptional regulator
MTRSSSVAEASDKEKRVEPTPGQERASIEEAVTQIIATMPRMFKTIKHQARSADTTTPAHDLGETQTWVLHALATGTQLTGELARRFNVTTPTITRMVDSMVERGYVERRPDSEDRRRIYLELTEAGTEVAHQAHEQFRASVARFLSPLSGEQLADIVQACGHLQSLLPSEGHDYGELCPARPREGDLQSTTDTIQEENT